jgi:hypothetical protein
MQNTAKAHPKYRTDNVPPTVIDRIGIWELDPFGTGIARADSGSLEPPGFGPPPGRPRLSVNGSGGRQLLEYRDAACPGQEGRVVGRPEKR